MKLREKELKICNLVQLRHFIWLEIFKHDLKVTFKGINQKSARYKWVWEIKNCEVSRNFRQRYAKTMRGSLCVILHFLLLQEDSGTKKFPRRLRKLPKKVKRPVMKRLINSKIALCELARNLLTTKSKWIIKISQALKHWSVRKGNSNHACLKSTSKIA